MHTSSNVKCVTVVENSRQTDWEDAGAACQERW